MKFLDLINFRKRREDKINFILNGYGQEMIVKLESMNQNELLRDLLEVQFELANIHFSNLGLDYDYMELNTTEGKRLQFIAYKKKTNNYSLLVGNYSVDLNSSQTANINLVDSEDELLEIEEGGN